MQKIGIPGKRTFTLCTSDSSVSPSLSFKETRLFLRVKDMKAREENEDE